MAQVARLAVPPASVAQSRNGSARAMAVLPVQGRWDHAQAVPASAAPLNGAVPMATALGSAPLAIGPTAIGPMASAVAASVRVIAKGRHGIAAVAPAQKAGPRAVLGSGGLTDLAQKDGVLTDLGQTQGVLTAPVRRVSAAKTVFPVKTVPGVPTRALRAAARPAMAGSALDPGPWWWMRPSPAPLASPSAMGWSPPPI